MFGFSTHYQNMPISSLDLRTMDLASLASSLSPRLYRAGPIPWVPIAVFVESGSHRSQPRSVQKSSLSRECGTSEDQIIFFPQGGGFLEDLGAGNPFRPTLPHHESLWASKKKELHTYYLATSPLANGDQSAHIQSNLISPERAKVGQINPTISSPTSVSHALPNF